MVAAEIGHLRCPRPAVAGETVDEDERRAASANVIEREDHAVDR
jgi:hypothetical protein